jgi:glycosyltransferase involved in cell wall biosynthesis
LQIIDKDLQKKSNAGIVVENNPDNIAKGIINLLNNPEKLTSMGKMGKEHINQNYNRADIFLKLNDSINDIN